MQALKNKLHLNKNANNTTAAEPTHDSKHHMFGKHHDAAPTTGYSAPHGTTTTVTPASAAAVHKTEAIASTLPHGSMVERKEVERNSFVGGNMTSTNTVVETTMVIPTAPPAPAMWMPERHEKWDSIETLSWTRGVGFYPNWGYSNLSMPVVERVLLPTQVIEKPMAVHEEIRREQIEEIQPVVNIEKLSTEVHQVTQPLFDKEVKAVQIEQRLLATEVLPEVLLPGRGVHQAAEMSSVRQLNSAAVVVEKPAIMREVDRLQIIEEIQPVLYKETVVPTVIQETKPVYQKIVEGAVYSTETLAAKDLTSTHAMNPGYVPSNEPAPAPVLLREALPVQIIEKPVAVHEEIRREQVEEIQPVISVEKISTEIRQITQPLFDKEIKPINLQQRTLATEILPEVLLPGRGMHANEEMSTIMVKDTAAVVVEKPALVREVDRLQIIEEIQPVLYKETVVPTVIQETKPVYQKIVEGAVYSQETLAAKDLTSTHAMNPGYVPSREAAPAPVLERMALPIQIVEKEMAVHEEIRNEFVEEIQPVINVEKLQTEVHQVTQPLFDKEIKPVLFEKRILATEILPEVALPGHGVVRTAEVSSVAYQDSAAVLIEKPAIVTEIDRLQVIEEIQPVLYKETVIPTVIQETKPVYQKIIEGPVYVQQTLPAKALSSHAQYTTLHTSTWVESAPIMMTNPIVSHDMSGVNLGRSPVLNRGEEKVFVEQTTTTTTSTHPTTYGF